MSLPPIELESSHRLVDNGVGDYALECPEHGVESGWLHLGMVAEVLASHCACKACGKRVN